MGTELKKNTLEFYWQGVWLVDSVGMAKAKKPKAKKKKEEEDLRTSRRIAHRLTGKQKRITERTLIARLRKALEKEGKELRSFRRPYRRRRIIWQSFYNHPKYGWNVDKTFDYWGNEKQQEEFIKQGILEAGEYL